MSGAQLIMSRLRHVRFVECKLDLAALRMITGEHVTAERCVLTGADLYAMSASPLVLHDCDLTGADVSQLSSADVRLQGSRLDGLIGAASLRAAAIDSAQILPLAMAMFDSLGIRIEDER